MTTKQMVKLVCPECQRQNEPERIYCHDCGARLDRTSLAKVAPKLEPPEQTQKRLKRLLDPTRARMKHTFFQASKMILGACAMAGLVEALLPPDMPGRVKSPELLMIGMDMENAMATHSTAPMQYNETQVNGYLVSALKSKQKALSQALQFERAVLKFDEGVCRTTVERSLFGFSVYTTISHKVAIREGTIKAASNGGSIGRLPIHPMLMDFGGILFGDVWTALDREKKLVAKMGSIEFHPQLVILTPRQKE